MVVKITSSCSVPVLPLRARWPAPVRPYSLTKHIVHRCGLGAEHTAGHWLTLMK